MALHLTGAQALVAALAAENIEHVFGIVGGKLTPLLHAIANQRGMRFMGVRHEAAGPMMAAAVHAGSGRMAVALGEMGPGGLNMASGMGVPMSIPEQIGLLVFMVIASKGAAGVTGAASLAPRRVRRAAMAVFMLSAKRRYSASSRGLRAGTSAAQ